MAASADGGFAALASHLPVPVPWGNRTKDGLQSFQSFLNRDGAGVPDLPPADLVESEVAHILDQAAAVAESKVLRSSRSQGSVIDWDSGMRFILEAEKRCGPQQRPSRRELDAILANQPTFNLAKLANDLPTVRRLVEELGVDVSVWETMSLDYLATALRIDWDTDVAPRLRWLREVGCGGSGLPGRIFTNNPQMFDVDVADLDVRIDYLRSKSFSAKKIARIVADSDAQWLNFTVPSIDSRLGYIQQTFDLQGGQVRRLAAEKPQLVIWPGIPVQLGINRLTVMDGMGFSRAETRALLLDCPDLFRAKDPQKILDTFNFVHDTIGYPHQIIRRYPRVLLQHLTYNVRPRHRFLVELNRAQYDPKKPNYVSPLAFSELEDAEFCARVAKVPLSLYNQFLKTL